MVESALTSTDFGNQALSIQTLELGSLADARILLIDDSNFARKTINAILSNHGFTNVELATDGDEGYRIAMEWAPEIVITDLYMPVKSGFDLCRELRELKRFRETPIIVQTSADTPALRGDVFEAGASDLITKPINVRELLSRIRVHLERLRLIESLRLYRSQMREELDSAKAMQIELLPEDQLIEQLEKNFPVRFAWHAQPCQGLAGDIWGADQLNDQRIRVWSADFTGHGVRSALNTFRLNTFLRTSLKDDRSSPAAWLKTVNEFLCEVLPIGQFATMLCCDLDFSRNRLIMASAGAPVPILTKDGKNQVIHLGGMPLGISDAMSYDEVELDFQPGSCLFSYSDVLVETPEPDHPLYNMERLVDELDQLSGTPISQWLRTLRDRLIAAAPDGLDDDLTLIFLEYVDQDKCDENQTNADAGSQGTSSERDLAAQTFLASKPDDHDGFFQLRTMAEASQLSERLAAHYPDPEVVVTGIWELLANAIEHGNLSIDYTQKKHLLEADKLHQEIETRLNSDEYGHRKVEVELTCKDECISLLIRDEGEGFDFDQYINGEAVLNALNGRGIAIAQKLCFDQLIYHGRGNVVEAIVNLEALEG